VALELITKTMEVTGWPRSTNPIKEKWPAKEVAALDGPEDPLV
jgi:hypothetical protein